MASQRKDHGEFEVEAFLSVVVVVTLVLSWVVEVSLVVVAVAWWSRFLSSSCS